jgi:cbb3-type cytochrome oxidase cytochrome c subunit
MKGLAPLFLGIFGTFAFSWVGLTVIPNFQIGHLNPQSDEEGTDVYPMPQSGMVARGARVYAANGCIYCHSQQVRAPYAAADIDRKWGDRRSAPRDYIFERPVFLGKARMGQDLANIGGRAPKEEESPAPQGAAVSGSPPTAASPATAPAASPGASPAPKAPGSPAPAASPGAASSPPAGGASPVASPSPTASPSPAKQGAVSAEASPANAAAASSPASPAATASHSPAASPAPKAPTSPAPASPAPQGAAASPPPSPAAGSPSPAAAAVAGASPAASPSPTPPWPEQTAGFPPMYSAAWHHVHLYAPRSINFDSNMPSYRFLYRTRRISDMASADALQLTGSDAPPQGWEVVPTYDAKCLVAYLMSLNQTHPLKEVRSAAPPAAPATSPAPGAPPPK